MKKRVTHGSTYATTTPEVRRAVDELVEMLQETVMMKYTVTSSGWKDEYPASTGVVLPTEPGTWELVGFAAAVDPVRGAGEPKVVRLFWTWRSGLKLESKQDPKRT